MEYNFLKYRLRQRQLPTQASLTVQFYLATVLIVTLHSSSSSSSSREVSASTLGAKCQHDMDCTDFIKGSSCSALGYCECAPYYVQWNTTTCLSSQLLGGDCRLNEQCTMKVANSSCLDGACRCVEGFLQFRKHTCLGPAPPGSVCYSHAHCQMFNERTHCDFLIPNLFGRCQCTAPAKLKAGLCVDNTIEEVQPLSPATSSTTTSTITPVTVKEETHVTSQPQISTDSPDSTVEVQEVLSVDSNVQQLQLQTTEGPNLSIEEQSWEDDRDIVQPTPKAEMQAESLTPVSIEAQHQQESVESAEGLEITNASDDYPYKIEEEEEDSQAQPSIHEHATDFIQETPLQGGQFEVYDEKVDKSTQAQTEKDIAEHTQEAFMEEEEHVEDYGGVVDNTMNFDYEAAQHEMEDHLDEENLNQRLTEVENQKQNLESNEEHVQESGQDREPEEEYNQVPNLEPEKIVNQLESETQENKPNHHWEDETEQPEEYVEQHKIEHDLPVQEEPESEKDHGTYESEPQQNYEHESQEKVHENEENAPNDQLEQNQEHEHLNTVEEEHITDNDKTAYEQKPDQASSELNNSEEAQEPEEQQEPGQKQEFVMASDNFPKMEHEQGHEENHELVHEHEEASFYEKEHGLEQSPAASYEQAHEQVPAENYIQSSNVQVSEQELELKHEDEDKRYQDTEENETITELYDNHELVEQQLANDLQQEIKQQSENKEQNYNQENPAQDVMEHIIPDNSEINDIPPPPEQNQESNPKESPSESFNWPSISNEIHHLQPDEAAAENESVQNENEANRQQQPEAVTAAYDEVIITQSPVLEEEEEEEEEAEEEEKNIRVAETEEHNNSDKQPQLVDATVVLEEKKGGNELEKFNGNAATGQIEDISVEQEQEQEEEEAVVEEEIIQQTTIKMPELENNTEEDVEDFDHQTVEKIVGPHEEEAKEIHTELPSINTDHNNQYLLEEEELKTMALDEKTAKEQPTTAASLDDLSPEQITEQQIIRITENENDLTDSKLEAIEQKKEEQLHTETATLTDSFFNEQKVDHKADINEIPNRLHDLENEEQENQNALTQDAETGEEKENGFEYHESENFEQNVIESTTRVDDLYTNIGTESSGSTESIRNTEDTEALEDNESGLPEEVNGLNMSSENKRHEEPTSVTNKEELKNEEETFENNRLSNKHDDSGSERIQGVTESFVTNYVPSQTNENNPTENGLEANEFDNKEVAETQNEVDIETQNSASSQESTEQPESEENVFNNQPEDIYFNQDQEIPSLVSPENEDFKESESISDILNNLMKTDITSRPEYSEELSFDGHHQTMHEADVPDLLAEDSNISEESVLSHQMLNKDFTEAHIKPDDKLITFYPDIQEVQPVQQLPITNQQQQLEEHLVEASGDDEKPQLPETENETAALKEHTLSPLDVPFDTSVDYEPQQFEADSLVIETTTITAKDMKPKESNEITATTANVLEEITTQTMLNLASRVTIMEPVAPITTTLKPLMSPNTNDEATSVPSIDAPNMESLLTTKPTTEIRKRVELSLEAVSLGLSCSNNKQCQLADPYTVCNANSICECAANIYSAPVQSDTALAQCGAERTGCSHGTFQCRSSGVCISWFFVCDGRSDCSDASDEECTFNKRFNQTCPSQAFQCGRSGRCISRAALCDGRKQCPHGEDELGCSALKSEDSCPPHTFRCKSGECLPEYEYCNAIITCRDGSDEPPHLCGSRSMPNFFVQLLNAGGLMNKNIDDRAYCPHRCSNGRCRSTAIVCSGRDGCGDGTDEQTCSVCRCPAVNMDRPAINVSEFLARHRPMPLW